MALYPIHARERDALGMFKAHSTDYSNISEGGLVVEMKADGNDLAIANHVSGAATDKGRFGLLDEQATTTKETMLGKYLPTNQTPVILGPATHLASGRVSVWIESGWFLTDNYDLTIDAYGEAASLSPGDPMLVTAGLLGDTGSASRIRFMKMIDDQDDLLASRVSPAPRLGLFAEKPLILIYQE